MHKKLYSGLYLLSALFLFQSCDFTELLGISEPSAQKSLLYFDGSDDIITIPDADLQLDSLSREITIEAWIKIKDFSNEYPRIIDRSDNISNDRFLLAINSYSHRAHFNINGYSINSDDSLIINKWYHIAGTYNGTELKIYVNGKLQGIYQVTQKMDVNSSDIYIGNNELLNRAFNGYIYEAAVWNIARTSRQILNDYKIGILPFSSGLVSLWKFDGNAGHGSGDTGQKITDLRGKNDGFLGRSSAEDASDPTWVIP